MSISKQLYQLQEIDLELEATEQAINQITGKLGEDEALQKARARVAAEQQHRDELAQQQRSLEWEIDDITSKLAAAEKELYSGRIRNPKELTNLEHEAEILKTKRAQAEDRALGIMDQVELATRTVATMNSELGTLEAEWQDQQKWLSTELEKLETILSDLKRRRQLLADEIDPQTLEVYRTLKKQKGTAVALVEQGICRGCRILLPVTELQQTRSGSLVRCGSCGRILYLA